MENVIANLCIYGIGKEKHAQNSNKVELFALQLAIKPADWCTQLNSLCLQSISTMDSNRTYVYVWARQYAPNVHAHPSGPGHACHFQMQ